MPAAVANERVQPQVALEKSLDKDEMRKWLKERGVEVSDDGGH